MVCWRKQLSTCFSYKVWQRTLTSSRILLNLRYARSLQSDKENDVMAYLTRQNLQIFYLILSNWIMSLIWRVFFKQILGGENGPLWKDYFEGGATWAFDVGSQSMTCPIIVEDLDRPRQMLVEVMVVFYYLFLMTWFFTRYTCNCDNLVVAADALRR